jgi:ABC-2 type transport system permease protein
VRVSLAITWKETQAYFTSPIGYIVALVYLALTGFFFVRSISGTLPEASVELYIIATAWIMIPLGPALTMGLLAEEQKLGTIELLLTAPVKDWEVVLGKFLASLSFFLVTLALTLFYVLLLKWKGDPDWGPVWSAYLGIILYGSTALSIGLLASSITRNQIVALVVGLGILLMLALIQFAADLIDGVGSTILDQLGTISHLDDFSRGIIDTNNIVYYVTVTAVFLFLTIRSLESRRWR